LPPVPCSVTICGEFDAESAIIRVAERGPFAVGVKVNEMGQATSGL